jgi:chromodomain-helicase-DNA-binding protein 1
LQGKIFLDEGKSKGDGTQKLVPGPIHLVRRGDYLCGLIREYEENKRSIAEQEALIAQMPVKEGFGFESPVLPVPAIKMSNVKGKNRPSSPVSDSKDKKSSSSKKRHKTPEFTSSEDDG